MAVRWHGILRVINDYRVRAVRVKQHNGEVLCACVHPERSALVGLPRTERVVRTLSSDGPRPAVCGNYWLRIKQDGGYVPDRDWSPIHIHHPSFVLFGYSTEKGYHTDFEPRPENH